MSDVSGKVNATGVLRNASAREVRTVELVICALLSVTSLGAAPDLASLPQSAYTNHAGIAVHGMVVRLDGREVSISNSAEQVTLPVTVFPESERRRMAADFASRTGDPTALRLPQDVRHALEASDKAIRRSANRAARGLCSEKESQAFVEGSRAARKEYLDKAVEEGRITPSERRLLN